MSESNVSKHSLLSSFRRSADRGEQLSAPPTDEPIVDNDLDAFDHFSISTMSSSDSEEDEDSDATYRPLLISSGPLPADDPGYTPSPLDDTNTSMEVCKWATSRNIAADIFWTRLAATEGNTSHGIPRRASYFNRADAHLYDIPRSLEINFPPYATGRKNVYLMNGIEPQHPRGAKGLKKPGDKDFPSWRASPKGLVPTEHHPQGVFIPQRSRLCEVETVEPEPQPEPGQPATPLGPNVTGRSLRRTKAMATRQPGESPSPAATPTPPASPAPRFKCCVEEERVDNGFLERAAYTRTMLASFKIENPILEESDEDEEPAATPTDNTATSPSLSEGSINWVTHGSGSEESSGSLPDDNPNTDAKDPLEALHGPLASIIEEDEEEEQKEKAVHAQTKKAKGWQENEEEWEIDEEEGVPETEAEKLARRMYELDFFGVDEADDNMAGDKNAPQEGHDEKVSPEPSTPNTASLEDLSEASIPKITITIAGHIFQPSPNPRMVSKSSPSPEPPQIQSGQTQQSPRNPLTVPKSSPRPAEIPLKPGQVFEWQKPYEEIVFRPRPGPPVPLDDSTEEEEEEADETEGVAESAPLPVLKSKTSLFFPARSKSVAATSEAFWEASGNATPTPARHGSAATLESILICQFEGDAKSECDADAFSIASVELQHAAAAGTFVEESTVVHHDGQFGCPSFLEAAPVRIRARNAAQLADIVRAAAPGTEHRLCSRARPRRRPRLPVGVKWAEKQADLFGKGPHLIVPEEDAVLPEIDFSGPGGELGAMSISSGDDELGWGAEECNEEVGEESEEKTAQVRSKPDWFDFF